MVAKQSLRSARALKHPLLLVAVITSILATCVPAHVASAAAQADLGWLRQGVRAWYLIVSVTESDQGKPSTLDLAGAYTVKGIEGGKLVVAEDYISSTPDVTLPSHDIVVPNPGKEGPFWISPAVLANLKTGDRVVWVGNEYVVSRRGMTSLGDLIKYFTASTLPALVALYLSGEGRELTARELVDESVANLQRDVVIIEGSKVEGHGKKTYAAVAFDVATGLMLARKFKATSENSVMMSYEVLAEINYDFLRKEAFTEPEGPHTGFTYSAMFNDMSTGYGFSVVAICVGRFKGVQAYKFNVILNPSYIIPGDMMVLVYDEARSEAYALNAGGGSFDLGIPRGKVVRIGDHIPIYVPPKDLSKDAITVWGVTLTNNGGGTFTASEYPQTFGFTQITFNEEGYAQSLGLYAVISGITINIPPTTPVHVDAFRTSTQTYESKLGGPAKPAPQPLYTPTTTQAQANQVQGGSGAGGTGNTAPWPSPQPASNAQITPNTQPPGGISWGLVGLMAGIAIGAVIAAAATLLLRRRGGHAYPAPPPPPPPA